MKLILSITTLQQLYKSTFAQCVRLFFNFLKSGHHINKRGWARVLEVFCIALLTGSAVVFLPMLSKCRLQDRSLMLRDSAGCLSEEDIFQISTLNNPKSLRM